MSFKGKIADYKMKNVGFKKGICIPDMINKEPY